MNALKVKSETPAEGAVLTQRILVVDDEPNISELIATSLRFVGFEVRTASNGSEALVVAEEFRPHAIVLDVMMPVLDGFETCKKLKADPRTSSVPVLNPEVLLTSTTVLPE